MMNHHSTHNLHIDSEFKSLLVPLTSEEFEQLEKNIKSDGCREPIVIWQKTIIDGHNRYKICLQHRIPFEIKPTHFNCREEAIFWICAHQLGRRTLSEETKKYLIGKKYETDKRIGTRNIAGLNQNTMQPNNPPMPSNHVKAAIKIGKEHNISHNTVYKYGAYANAIDVLKQKHSQLSNMILDGKLKISHDNLRIIAKLSIEELDILYQKITDYPDRKVSYAELRQQLQLKPAVSKNPALPSKIPIIKQAPKYDPDAEISSLSLTIPTWISSMNRTKNITAFDNTTTDARKILKSQLYNLRGTIDTFLALIKEDNT